MKQDKPETHYVYILLCADDTLYTGYTNDLEKRVHDHNNTNAGAKYTRSRRPCTLVYTERFGTKHEAMSREYYLKKLSHREREALVKTGLPGAGSTVRN